MKFEEFLDKMPSSPCAVKQDIEICNLCKRLNKKVAEICKYSSIQLITKPVIPEPPEAIEEPVEKPVVERGDEIYIEDLPLIDIVRPEVIGIVDRVKSPPEEEVIEVEAIAEVGAELPPEEIPKAEPEALPVAVSIPAPKPEPLPMKVQKMKHTKIIKKPKIEKKTVAKKVKKFKKIKK
ncbi:MAG: hypothetical protein AB1779_08370 [Candidatus Thermoplasmatota archaeon]